MFLSARANMFTNEIKKWRTMIWLATSLVMLIDEVVGLVPGIQKFIPIFEHGFIKQVFLLLISNE